METPLPRPPSSSLPPWLLDALLLLLLSGFSLLVSGTFVVAGKQPLEASAVAVVCGILLRRAGLVPASYRTTVRLGESLLGYGIVFLGASLNFALFVKNGPLIAGVIIGTMAAGYVLTFGLGRVFSLSPTLCALLAVGTTICGGSAIAVIAPLLKAPEEETSYAIGTITLWGVIALLLYPFLAGLLHVTDEAFGLFAGVAIHSTPQVVGAGFLYSDAAGKTATAVKLVRNCFIAPLAFIFALWLRRSAAAGAVSASGRKAFPWFLFGFFLMAGLNSYAVFSTGVVELLSSIARFLILVGMADVGLSTDLKALSKIGIAPLVVGFLGALAVAVLAVGAISLAT